jgi:hypothetical protein
MLNREQFERGAYDALERAPKYYGCHFGMRSTLEHDRKSYNRGYELAAEWLEGRGPFAKQSFDDLVCQSLKDL